MSHMNESWSVMQCAAVCCSVLQCERGMSHMNESCRCHIWMSHVDVAYEWVMECVAVCCSVLQRVAVCYSVLQCAAVCCSVLQCVAVCCSVNEGCHIWMSHVHITHEWPVSHTNESCRIQMRLVTRMCSFKWITRSSVTLNEWCHTWMSHVAYERVMSHKIGSCPTHIYELCHTHMYESCHA